MSQTQQPGNQAMEDAAAAMDSEFYVLRLYLAGPTPQACRAVVNIRAICEEHLSGRYELEVVDLLENPARAKEDDVIAAPSLVRISPLPARRFIGDLSQTEQILVGLGLA